MPSQRAAGTVRRAQKWPVAAAVFALLAFYVAMTLMASAHKGLSFDEGEQIAVGYDMWFNRDFRMEGANGDLVKRWATLPLLVSKPAFVSAQDPWWRRGGPYEVAFDFFFKRGNDPAALLRQCRAMIALLGIATGLLVFYCSRELFGTSGALISLTVFVSSPSMLAFGGMVSTEMSTCLTLVGSAWCGWRLLHRVTWPRLLLSLAFASLLVLSKPTAVVMFPLTAIMIGIKLACRRPLRWELGTRRVIRRRLSQAMLFAGLIVAHVGCGWLALWANYDFRYTASPRPADLGVAFKLPPGDPIDPTVQSLLAWSRRTHFLPEGYLRGIQLLLGQNESRPAFMNGQWTFGGWPTFFPYAMWVKTQPAFLLLLVVSFAGWWAWRRRDRSGAPSKPGKSTHTTASETLYAAVPFLGLIIVYFSIAITWDLNIGFRHMLPIYPAAYVLVGAVSLVWVRNVLSKVIVALLLAWHVAGPVGIYPHFLAYFSPLAGGPQEGYKHLVDSSLDWGMDLPGLKEWLDVHNPGDRDPVFFAYFGVGNPDYYHIKSFRLPGSPNWRTGSSFPLRPGIYAISATLLQGIGTPTVGPWNKAFESAYWSSLGNINRYDLTLNDPAAHAALLVRYPQSYWVREYARFDALRFGRVCAWLRHHRPPDDNVGYSILIWRLSAAEVLDAGLGPPAELADAPLRR